jgi:hypothetical protein
VLEGIRTKSSRHAKISGDFAEAFVLYWLSKYGYECARVDHTGIDLIARNTNEAEVMGISVKCRDRYEHQEHQPVHLSSDGFVKARAACEAFNCEPYYAIMVDTPTYVRCFLLSLAHLESIVGGSPGKVRYWHMSDKHISRYTADPLIKGLTMETTACSWRDSSKIVKGEES